MSCFRQILCYISGYHHRLFVSTGQTANYNHSRISEVLDLNYPDMICDNLDDAPPDRFGALVRWSSTGGLLKVSPLLNTDHPQPLPVICGGHDAQFSPISTCYFAYRSLYVGNVQLSGGTNTKKYMIHGRDSAAGVILQG